VTVAEQRFRMPDRVPVIVRDVEQLDQDGMEVCAISRHHRRERSLRHSIPPLLRVGRVLRQVSSGLETHFCTACA
jgi:hypothetical protein